MTNKERIKVYREKTIAELEEILNSPNSTEADIIIATVEMQDKEEKLGIAEHYTTEEVLENVFGRTNMVKRS